ncbi:MAG: hypothetical protein IPK93_12515 [Solirubrobacterales bacterium]|nr:hypothetical protein [Solirubrobacterales bacterium]
MAVLFAVILLVAVAAFVSYPFWGKAEASRSEDPELAGLEAARESKYREIRDAETDLASGKLSQEDFDLVNAELRGDAVEILKQLDQVESVSSGDDSEPAESDQSPPGNAGS